MSKLQDQVSDICKLATEVVNKPSLPLIITARHIGGLDKGVMAAAAGAGFIAAPFFYSMPIVALTKWLYDKYKDNQKKQQEKERMLREIIRKQQAVIEVLKKQQASNRQEIEHLKEMLRMLEEAEAAVQAA